MIREAGVSDDPERWIEGVEAETLAVLHTRGEATADELTKEVEGLRLQIPFGASKAWEGDGGALGGFDTPELITWRTPAW